MNKIYVVAGNYDQYRMYVRRKIQELYNQGNTSISMSDFVHVHNADSLRGLQNIHGFFVGTYRERSDLQEIIQTLRIINNIPPEEHVIPPLLMPLPGEQRMCNGEVQVYNGTKWITLVNP